MIKQEFVCCCFLCDWPYFIRVSKTFTLLFECHGDSGLIWLIINMFRIPTRALRGKHHFEQLPKQKSKPFKINVIFKSIFFLPSPFKTVQNFDESTFMRNQITHALINTHGVTNSKLILLYHLICKTCFGLFCCWYITLVKHGSSIK